MTTITVTKCDHLGQPSFQYTGLEIGRGEYWICIQATFGRADVDLGYVILRYGDVMTEWFFTDRWYNIFRIEDVHTGQLKGWYCNITRPASMGEDWVAADDLALDVFVSPSGAIQLVDEDEFEALALAADERMAVLEAVKALCASVSARELPFSEIG